MTSAGLGAAIIAARPAVVAALAARLPERAREAHDTGDAPGR